MNCAYKNAYGSTAYGHKEKFKFSKSRETYDFKIKMVGYSGNSSLRADVSIPGSSLFYFDYVFPGRSGVEISINQDINLPYIFPNGFDFMHDYFNIPTVITVGGAVGVAGTIRMSRRINNTWQSNDILNNISDLCEGPESYVPGGGPAAMYYRYNSPIMSMEFDPTNPDLVYVAYLRGSTYFNSLDDPAKINVCCYNMRTKTLLYNEPVVSAKYETGSLQTVNVQYIDFPTLYFDTSNNTLNLIFFGVEFNGIGYISPPGGDVHRYFKTKRLGANSWTTASYLFDDPLKWPESNKGYYGSQMTNSWELKTKY
jgi:hypothetical protein